MEQEALLDIFKISERFKWEKKYIIAIIVIIIHLVIHVSTVI